MDAGSTVIELFKGAESSEHLRCRDKLLHRMVSLGFVAAQDAEGQASVTTDLVLWRTTGYETSTSKA